MNDMERVGQIQDNPYNNLFERPGSDAFAKLFNAEAYFMVPQSYLNDKEKKDLRRLAVEIIESLSERYIDALIPYTAITYIDRFLSRKDDFPDGNTRLFVICCLTIAWKLRNKSFNLSMFLRERGLEYSTQDVLQMELEICRGLEWRMRTLTPFCFVDFFIPVLGLPPSHPSPRQPVCDLIVRSQCDIAFTEFRPSVMAASAMITVSSKLFPAQHHLFREKILYDVEPLRLLQETILNCINHLAPLNRNTSIGRERNRIPIDEPPARPPPPEQTFGLTQPIPIPGREPPPPQPELREMSEALSLPPGTDVEAARREIGRRPAPSETQPGTEGPMPVHRQGKEPVTSETQSEDDDDEEQKEFKRRSVESLQEALRRSQEKEPATSEIQEDEPRPRHRPGKEPVTSEIQSEDDDDEEHKEFERRFAELVQEALRRSQGKQKDYELKDLEMGWKELLKEANEKRSDGKDDELMDRKELLEEAERRDEPQHACLPFVQRLTDCCTKTATLCENVKGMICNIL